MGTDIHMIAQVRADADSPWTAAEAPVKNRYYTAPATLFDEDIEDYDPGNKEYVLPDFWDSRNYSVFAILAGVRNGSGFAGCDLGDGFIPIAEPRGLPEDMELDDLPAEYPHDSDYYGGQWLGEHTHSWLTLTEMLNYDWTQETNERGVIDAVQFEEWDRLNGLREHRGYRYNAPDSYCGDISGPNVRKVSESEMREMIAKSQRRHDGGRGSNFEPMLNEIRSVLAGVHARVQWKMSYAKAAADFFTDALPRLMKLGEQYGPDNVRIVFGFDS